MLLDVGNAIFVWLGKDSNENEKKLASEAASDYLSSDPTGRDKDIPVIVTKQGNEPPHFTGNFGVYPVVTWMGVRSPRIGKERWFITYVTAGRR